MYLAFAGPCSDAAIKWGCYQCSQWREAAFSERDAIMLKGVILPASATSFGFGTSRATSVGLGYGIQEQHLARLTKRWGNHIARVCGESHLMRCAPGKPRCSLSPTSQVQFSFIWSTDEMARLISTIKHKAHCAPTSIILDIFSLTLASAACR